MTEKSSLIDSNLLVYAYELDDVRSKTARELIRGLAFQNQSVLSVQNLAEFGNVVIGKKRRTVSPADAQIALDFFAENFRVVAYGPQTVTKAIGLVQTRQAPFYDALLAATMLENGVDTIYTENAEDFAKIPGIRAINPFE